MRRSFDPLSRCRKLFPRKFITTLIFHNDYINMTLMKALSTFQYAIQTETCFMNVSCRIRNSKRILTAVKE
ncbi:hypothetical protein DBV15_10000 [Temnothorax longispinosus]|uniref:Uncharacterized protein n=1 Tax=Temnothorax longispinosus TaxID=300112 RepID=A0A4S2KQG1_9HYME|nr:hypothetical protein DBV15_10000 [Temnothorax longispinosus]